MSKELLFSITKKDFEVQTFRAGGKGGQHQNKTSSAVRIIHRESGAVGESREERSQYQNKKIALRRLVGSVEFQRWINQRVAEIINKETIDEKVDKMLSPENLTVEFRENNKWVKEVFEIYFNDNRIEIFDSEEEFKKALQQSLKKHKFKDYSKEDQFSFVWVKENASGIEYFTQDPKLKSQIKELIDSSQLEGKIVEDLP